MHYIPEKTEYKKELLFKNITFSDAMGTTEHFWPMVGISENTNVANHACAMIMPTTAKVLQIHLRTSTDHSGQNTTLKLYKWATNVAHANTGVVSLIGTKIEVGPSTTNTVIYDFSAALDSGISTYSKNEMMSLGIINASSISDTCKYMATMIIELDWSDRLNNLLK